MLISTVFIWVAIAAGFVIALPSLWLLGVAIWPKALQRRTKVAAQGLGVSFLVGLLPLVVTVAALSRLGKGGPVALVPSILLLSWGFASADGLATFVGRSLWPDIAQPSVWKQTVRGGLVLVGAALLPAVGWVLFLPMIAVFGWGISIRSWFLKRSESVQY
jgi:hypothetical protein